jgi:hypothetical protein
MRIKEIAVVPREASLFYRFPVYSPLDNGI